MSVVFRLRMMPVVLLLLSVIATLAFAQFPVKVPKLPVRNPFEKEPPLSTSLADAVTEVPFLDDFEPGDIAPLSGLRRGPNNGFMIQPGAYMFSAQSYCYHAGTHSPSRGKGYLYAPLKGPSAGIIRNVLSRSVSHPNIAQHHVQALVWAILARTKPSNMNADIMSSANVLLTRGEINQLEGSAFHDLSQDLFDRALGELPPETRQVFEAERLLRDAVSRSVPYDELERIAVLTGEPLPGKHDRQIPSGRWSYHPEGYFIRYYPEGYQTTQMDVYVPEDIVIKRDTSNRVISILWKGTRQLLVEYDDAVSPLAVDNNTSFKAYAFKSIRLELAIPRDGKWKFEEDLGAVTVAEWTGIGWTFAGVLGGRGRVAGESRYPNATARYDTARKQNDELRTLLLNIRNLDKSRRASESSQRETATLLTLMQLASALKELAAAKVINRENLLFDPVELAQRAWASELRNTVSANEPVAGGRQPHNAPRMSALRNTVGANEPVAGGRQAHHAPRMSSAFAYAPMPYPRSNMQMGGGEFNPDNGAASPGETGRQRLGMSSRPTDKDRECKGQFSDCQTDSGGAYLECFAACGASMPSKPTLGQLNDARKCFSACESNYSNQNRECSRAAKRCLKQ